MTTRKSKGSLGNYIEFSQNAFKNHAEQRKNEDRGGKSFLQELKKEMEVDGLEDGRVTNAMIEKLQIIEVGCLVASLFGLALIVIQYELEFYQIHDKWSEALLYLIFITSIFSVYKIVLRYLYSIEFMKMKKLIPMNENLYTTGKYIPMLSEICLIMVIPYPWIRGNVTVAASLYDDVEFFYHQNEILSLFATLRVFTIVRILLLVSYWRSNRAQRLCVNSGELFAVRCTMKEHPFLFIFALYLFSIPFFGWMLRISEFPLTRVDQSNLGYTYPNAMWNVIITMTTVGYGDLYARTFLGRMVTFFICIWGTCVISLMVVVLTNVFNLEPAETRAYSLLTRLRVKESLDNDAASVITTVIRGRRLNKLNGQISEEYINKAKESFENFKSSSMAYRNFDDQSITLDDLARYTKNLRDEIRTIKQDQNELTALVKQALGKPAATGHNEQRLFTENAKTDVSVSHFIVKSENNPIEIRPLEKQRLDTEEGLLGEESVLLKKNLPNYESIHGSPY